MAARSLVRAIYYTGAHLIRWILCLCGARASTTSTVMGSSHSLGQLSVVHPEAEISPEPETEMGETTAEEQVVEDILEDIEVGMVENLEAGEIELEEQAEGSVAEEKGDEGTDAAEDNHLDCWDWPHNWEDLDWDEEMWIEDETASADIEEAILPDELWE